MRKIKVFQHAKELSDDTIALPFGQRSQMIISTHGLDICQPTVERINKMFSSVAIGDSHRAETEVDNYFYCCTLSSAAARIAVRDWLAVSVSQYQNNLRQWFARYCNCKKW